MEILSEIVFFFIIIFWETNGRLKTYWKKRKLAEKNLWKYFRLWSEVQQVLSAVFSFSHRKWYKQEKKCEEEIGRNIFFKSKKNELRLKISLKKRNHLLLLTFSTVSLTDRCDWETGVSFLVGRWSWHILCSPAASLNA